MYKQLTALRHQKGLTQEALADILKVSRQAYGRWEKGDSLPDIEHCIALADFYGISLDELAGKSEKRASQPESSGNLQGKHIFGSVFLNERGQILIPKKARDIFKLQPGDRLILLGDEVEGLALVKKDIFSRRLNAAMKMAGTVNREEENLETDQADS